MFAQCGTVLLLFAASRVDDSSSRYGVPSSLLCASVLTEEQVRRTRSWLTLAGRLLVISMCVNVLVFDWDYSSIVWNLLALTCAVFIAIGWRTKQAAGILCVSLAIFNFKQHAFWAMAEDTPIWIADVIRRSFFLVLNVIGGLLTLTYIGAGSFSMDERKKRA